MNEFDDTPELDYFPAPDVVKQNIPEKKAKEMAFYGSSLKNGTGLSVIQQVSSQLTDSILEQHEIDYDTIYADLVTQGESSTLDDVRQKLLTEDDERTKNTLTEYISDPTINTQVKNLTLTNYLAGAGVRPDLHDMYTIKAATEDNATSQVDRDSHDILLNSFQQQKDKAQELEGMLNQFQNSISPDGSYLSTLGSVLGGVARDIFVPGSNAASLVASLKKENPDLSILKGMALTGELSRDIGMYYDALSNDDKVEFMKVVLPEIAKLPGTSWNKHEVLSKIIDNPETGVAYRTFENAVGLLDVYLAGKLVTAPINTAKNVLKFAIPDASVKKFFSLNAAKTVESASTQADIDAIKYVYTPRVAPNSAMGIVSRVNPQKASKARVEALLDDSGKLADAMGTSRGDILSEQLPAWVKSVDEIHPDIAEKLKANDTYFTNSMNENILDPNFTDVTVRAQDKEVMYRAFKESKGAYYQQANSIMVDDLTSTSGTAVFGRNAEFGFDTSEDATRAMQDLQEVLPASDRLNAKVVQKGNGQHYVEYNYSKQYDPFTEFAMGTQTVSANIYPIPFSDFAINMDAVARSFGGRALFNPTTMYTPWITKAAAGATMRASKVEGDFIKVLKDEIISVPHKEELGKELRLVQENQTWKDFKDLAASNSHLNENELKELYSGYVNYRRLTDYQYEWANVADHKTRAIQGQKAIHDDAGKHVGYGSEVSEDALSKVKYAWDMDAGVPIKLERSADGKLQLNGRQVVKLDGGINKSADEIKDIQEDFLKLADDNIFEYAVMGGKTSLKPLPQRTLTRIEGYIPRQNIENWYVKKIPKAVRVNGDTLVSDINKLRGYSKTIGAEWSETRANLLKARLEKEHPNYTFEVAMDRMDSADAIITDHKVYQQMLDHSKKRGERLPTLDGKARLEDPLEALASSIRSSVRLGVWSDYQDVFRKNYVKAFGEFTQQGQFPNVLTDLVPPVIKTKEAIVKFKAAQQLFKQYSNQQYKVTVGDEVWKSLFHGIGDVLEKTNIRGLSETARDIAKEGNVLIKAPKTLASTLFLHLNPPRQWIVQMQQLVEWSAIDPSFAIKRLHTVPAIGMAILSRASYMKNVSNGTYRAAQKMSGMDAKEFDDVVNAIHSSGIPQSVDLNMMLHGMFDDAKYVMDKSVGRAVYDRVANVVRAPGQIGKAIGYTPAELSNTIGTWIFARDRWIKQNPNANWNTPQNIARISGDAWDLTNSMSTRAGALPYQDGFLGLFFQFAAVQQKSLMTLFSGKTLTKNERGRLIAARMTLWGMYGTAMGGMLDKLVTEIDDPEFQAKWHEYKGGLMDVITNKLVMDNFKEAGEKESTLAVSGSMSPMPASHPIIQVVEELMKAIDGNPVNPRFAFTGAVGGIYEAANDMKAMFTMNDYSSDDALKVFGKELAESASGYNNWAKAMMIAEYGNKVDKLGRSLDLELTQTDMIAQMFGIITREEQFQYKVTNAKFEEMTFVKTRAKELNDYMKKNRHKYGDDDFKEFIRKFRLINSATPPEIQDKVEEEFRKLNRQDAISAKDSNFRFIINNIQEKNSKSVNEMLGYLMASKDSASQKLLQRLREAGVLNEDK